MNHKITFIGGGKMACAMLGGLLQAGVAHSQIHVAEPSASQRQWLQDHFRVQVYAINSEAVVECDLLVVAVKPGVVDKVVREVQTLLAPETVVLSIAAGVKVATLQQNLMAGQPVVRAMPNTPALVGAGITAYYASAEVQEGQRLWVEKVLSSMGEVVVVKEEGQLDAVTALSGSGPAYVYLMAEALSDGGVACGLTRDIADRLAFHTLLGSARLLVQHEGRHPGELKNQVTSPGGTTMAGLSVMEKKGVRGTLIATVRAAWKRARALGNAS